VENFDGFSLSQSRSTFPTQLVARKRPARVGVHSTALIKTQAQTPSWGRDAALLGSV